VINYSCQWIKETDGSTGCYIQSAADDSHVYYAGAAEGVATNHDPKMLPSVIQSQLVSNEYFFDTFKIPSDGMVMENFLIPPIILSYLYF
jgi:hypothetical protein